MKTHHEHYADALEAKVQEKIEYVRFWMSEGMTRDEACAKVSENSIMGDKLRARVREEV